MTNIDKGKCADQAFDKLHLDVFDETDAPRYLRSKTLRLTCGADYAPRINFDDGEVLQTVLKAVDIVNEKDPSISTVIRAKAQLLLDAAAVAVYQEKHKGGPLAKYLKGIQMKEDHEPT